MPVTFLCNTRDEFFTSGSDKGRETTKSEPSMCTTLNGAKNGVVYAGRACVHDPDVCIAICMNTNILL